MSLLYHFLDRPDACPAKKHIFVTGLSHQQNGLLDCDSLYVDNRLTHQQSPSHRCKWPGSITEDQNENRTKTNT